MTFYSLKKAMSLKKGDSLRLQGLTPQAQAFVAAGLALSGGGNMLIISPDTAEAERLSSDIDFFMGESESEVIYLPQWEILPYEPISPHPQVSSARFMALRKLSAGRRYICVTTLAALMQRCPPPRALENSILKIEAGKDMDMEKISSFLAATGYVHADPVEEPGTFTLRGGLLDIFPPNEEKPCRVEFFGDTAESIRHFDSDSQRSLERRKELLVPPMRETHYHGANISFLIGKVRELEKKLSADLSQVIQRFEAEQFFPAMEFYLPWFHPESSTPLDLLEKTDISILCEPPMIRERLETFRQQVEDGYKEALARKDFFPPPENLYLDEEDIEKVLANSARLEFTELADSEERDDCLTLKAREAERLRGAFSRLIYDSRERLKSGISTLVVTRSGKTSSRAMELFAEEDMGVKNIASNEIPGEILLPHMQEKPAPAVLTVTGKLSSGFVMEDIALSVITEEEIFGRHHIEPRREKRAKEAVFITDFSDVKPGDYVVHRDHGIGLYHGVRGVSVGGKRDEYMEIEYAEDQRLFMPLSSIYVLEKYSGAGGPRPTLDRMGGKTWQKTREKVKKGIMRMAKELLEIYARRQTAKPFTFSPDGTFHREFADSFPFTETPDQATAIGDVSADMESGKPMDRLVCGDVGYGKTEVALRAAFKASIDGKQTAVLAPTTILVKQHYDTFKSRMEAFGVRIAMLSRFVSKLEQKETLKAISEGKLDIVIGTHRLLQKDVEFADLGLVIVDEEQRFGVGHKEKLKKVRESVDVLTLSATPIPRTLHMSISGIRNISIINTPPPSRLSIKTAIRKFEDKTIKEAIDREMSRGGQVFFLHNSVRSIWTMQRYLKQVAPSARVAVAHGQMDGETLEKIMEQFIKHKVDVLLCTTIIESGLDIPNANTIIINRADRFGLAQLYQLRGRVGRDKHRAYSYLLVPETLTPDAKRRLKAMEELSELGSGFKLAARDMEIRGAGNLLGPQQSGNITAVGFETYCRMLSEAVDELRGGGAARAIDTALSLDFVGKIEDAYIPRLEQRMNFYNRLYRAGSFAEIAQISEELTDRYGPLPDKMKKLIDAVTLRLAGVKLGIEKLVLEGVSLSLFFAPGYDKAADVATAALRVFPGRVRPLGESALAVDVSKLEEASRAEEISRFLIGCVKEENSMAEARGNA